MNDKLPEETQNERWQPVPEYDGKYEVSNKGNVRTTYYGSPQNISLIPRHEYLVVSLYKDGKNKTHRVHRLVAKCFIPNPENYPVVNHKDGNKHNNASDNLEWTTTTGNVRHAVAMAKRSGGVLNDSKPKIIYCPEDDTVCNSIAEASKRYKIDKKTIKEYIKTGGRTINGKSFQIYTGKRINHATGKCQLSDIELIERCENWLDKLIKSGGRDWVLQVPANFSEDPDLLFMELINRLKITNPPK